MLLVEPFLSSTTHLSVSGWWTLLWALQISPSPAGQAGQSHKPLHGLLLVFYGPPLLIGFVAWVFSNLSSSFSFGYVMS